MHVSFVIANSRHHRQYAVQLSCRAMNMLRCIAVLGLLLAVQRKAQAQVDPTSSATVIQTLDAFMPAAPETVGKSQADQYLCTSVPLPDLPLKLNSIKPQPGRGVTHMLLFGASAAPGVAGHCISRHIPCCMSTFEGHSSGGQ